jgi:hypothetical protein
MARRSIVKFEDELRARVEAERQKLADMEKSEERRAADAAIDIANQSAKVDALAGVLEDLAGVDEDESEQS